MSTPLDTDRSMSTELVDLRQQILELQQALTQVEHTRGSGHASALSAAQVGTWEWDGRTNRVLWSPETGNIFGIPPGSFDGTYEGFFALVHPDDRQQLQAAIAKAVEDRTPYRIEHRIITPGESVRWVACRGRATFRNNEPVTGMIGTIEDVTAQKEWELAQQDFRETLERQVRERTAKLEQAITALTKEVERRQGAESALKASEQRYQSLYEQNPFMYFTLTADGTVLSVNQFGAAQLGYEKEDLVGQSVMNVFDVKDHQAVQAQLKACVANPYTLFQWDAQKTRNDGTRLWVKERARAIHDQTKQLLILISCEDITERRLAEEQLRESEARWRALYEHAGVGIAQLSLDGRFLRVNPRLCQILGCTEETMLRGTFREFTHPDDLPANLNNLDELLAGVRPSFSIEKRYRRRDDTWVWVDLTVSLVRAGSGEPAYFIAVLQHINDRKQTEQALKEQEALLRSVIETATDAIYMKDREGRYQFINSAGALVIGKPSVEIIGKKDDEIFPQETATQLMAVDQEVFVGSAPRSFEEVITLNGPLGHSIPSKPLTEIRMIVSLA